MKEQLEMIRKICDSKKHKNPLRDIMRECLRDKPEIVCLCGSTRSTVFIEPQERPAATTRDIIGRTADNLVLDDPIEPVPKPRPKRVNLMAHTGRHIELE